MKSLKFPDEDKELSAFNERLAQAESKAHDDEEELLTVSEVERIMAKLRLSRAKERYGPGPGGNHGYEDVEDEITDFEIDYVCLYIILLLLCFLLSSLIFLFTTASKI